MSRLLSLLVAATLACSTTSCASSESGTPSAAEATRTGSLPTGTPNSGPIRSPEQSTIDYWKSRIVLPDPRNPALEARLQVLYNEMNSALGSSLDEQEQTRLKTLASEVVWAAATGAGRDRFPELWESGSRLDGPGYKTVSILASVADVHRTSGEPFREVLVVYEGPMTGGLFRPFPLRTASGRKVRICVPSIAMTFRKIDVRGDKLPL
jgi:hypothetical protein